MEEVILNASAFVFLAVLKDKTLIHAQFDVA
jgi:hypothetical protein